MFFWPLPTSDFPIPSRDAKCGKIQCQSSAAKPKGPNTISMDTTIRFNGREIKCRGTLVYATKDDEGDMADPGLVVTGTKCGKGMVSALLESREGTPGQLLGGTLICTAEKAVRVKLCDLCYWLS